MFAIHAPAKVNLYLHVGPARPDGRHPLDSLVVFADQRAADRLIYHSGESSLDFTVSGPGAGHHIRPEHENLVIRAVRALEHASGRRIGGELHLEKQLPIAAGIGGGSSDAAATLRLLNAACQLGFSEADLMKLAVPLGGDVPACVAGRPVLMRGDGDRVEPFMGELPELHAVLVCPAHPCPTGPVFRAFDAQESPHIFAEILPPSSSGYTDFVAALTADYRNDLQGSAVELVPQIGDALKALSDCEGAGVFAMSGSGATCYALFETDEQARLACHHLKAENPTAWVVQTRLGEAGFDPTGFSL